MSMDNYETLTVTRDGNVLVIGLNRPDKRNAFNRAMINELAEALGKLDTDDGLRVGVLYGEGKGFTSGLDLPDVVPSLQDGSLQVPEGGINPWQVDGRRLTKPLVAAVHGKCLTLGSSCCWLATSSWRQKVQLSRSSRSPGGYIRSVVRPCAFRVPPGGATQCAGC